MWYGRAKELFEKLEPLAESIGLKIVEIDIPANANGICRLYVDSLVMGEGVTLDECAKFSPIVSNYLDTIDAFPYKYYLEISSPGLDRPIRRWDEIEFFIGKKLKIQLREKLKDKKNLTAILISVNNNEETFSVDENGEIVSIEKDLVKKINIIWEGDN